MNATVLCFLRIVAPKMSPMELQQQLKYFQEVAVQQHVTRAAEKLSYRSAVSRAISQLEEELGVPLFHREGRSVVLSKFGISYLTFVRQVLNILESASQSLHEGTSAETETVAFDFIGSLGAELVPRLVEAFRKNWPMGPVHPDSAFRRSPD